MRRLMRWLRRCLGNAFPPGHFYSPIPDFREVERKASRIFDRRIRPLEGIDVHDGVQLALFEQLKTYYPTLPFTDAASAGLRYYYANSYFGHADAIILACMIRHLRPARIIEIGSGFSSAVMLDVNDCFLQGEARITFIEPDAKRLRKLLREGEIGKINLIEKALEDVDASLFQELGAGDILFIDSTHVAKIGSDVNRLFFEVLPALPPGVWIHVHDIFYPFEYPKSWVLGQRRAWNEAYLLRAFLTCNDSFHIMYWNDYFTLAHRDLLAKDMPQALQNTGGSIWLKRVG